MSWTVLKLDDVETPMGVINRWVEIGEAESRYTYGGPEAQHVGEKFGVGDYIFIDGKSAERMRIVQAPPTFMEAPESEPAPAFA